MHLYKVEKNRIAYLRMNTSPRVYTHKSNEKCSGGGFIFKLDDAYKNSMLVRIFKHFDIYCSNAMTCSGGAFIYKLDVGNSMLHSRSKFLSISTFLLKCYKLDDKIDIL